MNCEVNTIFFVLGLIILVRNSSACGTKLEKGTVMCILPPEETALKPFEFELCTHAFIYQRLKCADNACLYQNLPAIERAVQWALPSYPKSLGISFIIDSAQGDFLFANSTRRSNTVDGLVKFMKDKGLTFVALFGSHVNTEDDSEKNQEKFFRLLEELSAKFQDAGFHIGLHIQVTTGEVVVKYDMEKLSTFVDWFLFVPSWAYRLYSKGTAHMEPVNALTTTFYGNSSGSTKYWIEQALEYVRPECLLFNLGPFYHTSSAVATPVEPGPGSLVHSSLSLPIYLSALCRKFSLSSECREYWDDVTSTPWAVCGDNLYSYDNPRSLMLKVDLVKKYNITGLMLYAVDLTIDNECTNPTSLLRAAQGFRQKKNSTL